MKIGIIGLGDIGGNLAAWLASCGHEVTGYDIDPAAAARAAARGVTPAGSRAELVERAEVIVTSLADLAAVRTTYFAEDGLIALAGAGRVTVECSTLPPDLARQITAARCAGGGVAIEAAVIGIGKDALAGQLYLMAAGDPASIERARPFLDAAGRGWLLTGASGTAAIAKVLNNGVGAATLCAIAEALALAAHHGIAPATLVEAMRTGAGAGASVVLDRHGAFMAEAEASTRPFNPIASKDAAALGALLPDAVATALPMLAGMVATYRETLTDAGAAAPEVLTRCAHRRLKDATST
ncbi:MAG: NAD(P)-dependent oxidoreductase [Geminicoccaceae bacterium]|nr:NAD(P)-dependent oxidoreductase [Geminicoccaceae bacterium]MCB9969391.1 NAD(P)-dependent oxidoreductase [Geminicoccaceae bacterium]HRY25724.1 NAD(P)-binding domain-containing protein [Geminicoccaceae bacterium]